MRLNGLLFILFWILLGAGCGGNDIAKDGMLSGKVTLDGTPLTGGTVFAKAVQGEASGFINIQGEYTLDNPPVGDLEFKIVAVPPPPPGVEIAPQTGGPGQISIPREFQNYSKGLTFKYEGGNQRFDISMKRKN